MKNMLQLQFKNFITLQRGFDLPKKDRVLGDYPVVASTAINGYHAEHKVQPPGVVTGRSGSLGEVLYIDKPFWPLNTTLWVKDFIGNLPLYVYYFLKTLDLKQYNSGAGVPTLNRNHLDTLEIAIHDFQSQRKIAFILSAYDDLIENNLRRIKILEEMAQAIYREWFVKFRFPGHEKTRMVDSPLGKIPEGWEIVPFKTLINCVRDNTNAGDHLSDRLYVPIDCIPRHSLTLLEAKHWKEAKSSLILFEEGDILFGAMRPYFHKVVVAPFKGVTRTTCFVLRPKTQLFLAYATMTAFQDETIGFASAHSRGATIPYAVWDGSLAEMDVLLPSELVITKFSDILSPILRLFQAAYYKVFNLRRTRDLLLPKLISGELDVSELDIKTGGHMQ